MTAAYELLDRTDIVPVVLEKSTYMGGISRTVNYKGNRIDIGGHRFFSKSDRVMQWWFRHLPPEAAASGAISYRQQQRPLPVSSAENPRGEAAAVCVASSNGSDEVMLVRQRKSRIYFLRKFFEYPIHLSSRTLINLGLVRTTKIGFSYMRALMFPPRRIENLEEFFISRFGRELYRTFFKSYTEKVWGVACHNISAEWGAQRIKGLSITKTITHMLRKVFRREQGIAQKDTETSLIEQFLYPKYGPGQMWEIVARKIEEMGGKIVSDFDVTKLQVENDRIVSLSGLDSTGTERTFAGDYFFSTMPVKELIRALDIDVPRDVVAVSDNLQYRDFITVGLLLRDLKVKDSDASRKLIADNWIYIQEPDVLAGRLQIFNNWSPYLVANPEHVWVGVEYFCYESDELWNKSDSEMAEFAAQELARIDIINAGDVLDSTVLRMPKTYPAYFGSYSNFGVVRDYVDRFENLFLIGRNGMHKYNNQDHSMLTAMTAVDNIIVGRSDKSNLWELNTEAEYHEEKS